MLGSIITRYVDTKQMKQMSVNSHNWDKLTLILEQIDNNYVDSVNYSNIIEKTLPHLMKELDPHSLYLPAENLKSANEELDGNFDGIGIVFNVPSDTAVVINVIVGGPSERAGLLSGDRIMEVDGKKVAGVKISQDTLVSYMRGPAGTKVNLKILRGNDIVSFDIIRDKIPVKSVDIAYMVNDTTAYIKLSKFARTSYIEFMKAMIPFKEAGMKKLIFDLRDNTGGYLDQALLLSNEFLEKGKLIVYMEGRNRPRQDFKADGGGKFKDVDLAVLINENSASSSEIFAGAIQDNDRGLIYGRRSFGKGLVQESINFSDMSGIRLTVARFYTPTGRSLQKPYTMADGKDYSYDIIERYQHGEMTDVDSIPKNDSLVYTTPKGKKVYGGGGITPDVFVPIDTIGVTDLLVNINRKALLIKFSIDVSDQYRKSLREVKDIDSLNALLDTMDLENRFVSYLHKNSIKIVKSQWNISKDIMLLQIRAMVGRYSVLDDAAFYPIIAPLDNVIQKVLE